MVYHIMYIQEKYNIKVLNYLQYQRFFRENENIILRKNFIKMLNCAIIKEEIPIKTFSKEFIGLERRINIPQQKILSKNSNLFIIVYEENTPIALLKSRRDSVSNTENDLYLIPIIFVNEIYRNTGIANDLLLLYFNKIIINKKYKIKIPNQNKLIQYFKKFGFCEIENDNNNYKELIKY